MPTRVLAPLLCLGLVTGCGASSLSDLSKGSLVLGLERFQVLNEVSLSLVPQPGGPCPTLAATATLNGVSLRVLEPGGVKRGSYFFVPTESCSAASFSYEGGGSGGGTIALEQPLALTVRDSSTTVEVASEDALVAVPQLEPASSRRPGDTLTFTLNRPAMSIRMGELSFRRVGESVWQTLQVGVSGSTLTAPLPSTGTGSFEWLLTVRALFPASVCTGVASCEVWLATTAEGQLTVVP